MYIKKIYHLQYKKKIVYSTNMPNIQQNNEIEHINKEMILLQDLLKKNDKKGQRANLSQTKNIQNIVKYIFQNKIKQIKKNANILQNTLVHAKKERDYLKKA